jgi:uncharacterized coiled-coil protein SlyX
MGNIENLNAGNVRQVIEQLGDAVLQLDQRREQLESENRALAERLNNVQNINGIW